MSIKELETIDKIKFLLSCYMDKNQISEILNINPKTVYRKILGSGCTYDKFRSNARHTKHWWKKYNRLLVCDEYIVSGGKRLNMFICDCGNIIYRRLGEVVNGNIKSCGCLKKEILDKNRLPYGVGASNQVLISYKNNAKKRGYLWELTDEQALEIMSNNCYYCGKEPSNLKKAKSNNGDYIYNGIDRKDNTKGYTLDNCVPCCGMCNKAKHNHSLDEFFLMIKRIYELHKLGD